MNKKHNFSRMGLAAANTKQFFRSGDFYISVVLAVLVMLFTFWSNKYANGKIALKEYGVCHDLFYLFYFDMLPKLVVLISSLPAVAGFCRDWNSGYARFAAGRAGVSRYLRHKVYACILGTFLTAFISLCIFSLILLGFIPITAELGTMNLQGIYPLGKIIADAPYLFLFLKILCFSSFCTMWSVCGLALSAYIPNHCITGSAAFIFYYVAETIFNNLLTNNVPTWLMLPYLGLTALTQPLFGNIVVDVLYINVLFIGLALAIGMVFVHGAGRRMRNEII